MSDLISRADAINKIMMDEFNLLKPLHKAVAKEYIENVPSADADGEDLIIKGAKGIQDGLYNIKDGKLFMYKANGGTVRIYPIVPSAEPIERISDNTIVVKYADYEDIGRIILTNGDIFCKMFYEDARQNDDSDYDSLVPDEYKTEPSDLINRADAIDAVHEYFKGRMRKSKCDYDEELQVYVVGKEERTMLTYNKGINDKLRSLPSAEPIEDYSDLPDIPRAYYEKIVGNMAHEINMLKEQLESADAVHGEWIFNPTDAISLMFAKPKCSNCGFESSDGGNFCPRCGARMKGGDDE